VSAVWLFFALFVAVLILEAFSYFSSNRPRGTSPSRNPTNIAAAPMVSSATNAGQPSRAGVPLSSAASTNSPLLDPSFKMPEDPVELLNYGTALLDRGWINEAIALYSKALEKNPEDEEVHFNLAYAYTKKGKTNEAMEHYDQALKLFPDYVEAHDNLGNLLVGQEKYAEAMEHFSMA